MESAHWLMEPQPPGRHSYYFILFHKLNNKNLHHSRMGSICLNRTRRSARSCKSRRRKKQERKKKDGKLNEAKSSWEWWVFWSACGASFSWTCEANERSRRSIWSEAGSRTQRPNRNYVPHRGDVQEDCLAPFVVNKSAEGVGCWGMGEGEKIGGGVSLFPPCPQHPASWWMVDKTCRWADWKRLPEWTCVSNLFPAAHRLFMWGLGHPFAKIVRLYCNTFPHLLRPNSHQWPLLANVDLGVEKSAALVSPVSHVRYWSEERMVMFFKTSVFKRNGLRRSHKRSVGRVFHICE